MKEKLKDFFLKNYGVDCNENTSIAEIAEDSLARMELLFELEQSLDISISHEEVLNIETINDLIKILDE